MDDILKIGKYSFDVSDIAQHKSELAAKRWNKANGIICYSDGSPKYKDNGELQFKRRKISQRRFQREILSIGLFLIRQMPIVLYRKFGFWGAIKEITKRHLFSYLYLKTLPVKEIDKFVEWIQFVITGKKKATISIINKTTEVLNEITDPMTEEERLQFEIYVSKSLYEMAGKWNISKHSQENK